MADSVASPARVARALLSVFDKQGVVELARELHAGGVEILSSGGTARLLTDSGVEVTAVSEVTGFPEMLGGRVKTLHPKIHGGILAKRSDPDHLADLEANGIGTIDLVVVNLYPFRETVADPSRSPAEIVEMIDIGGPAMVRAAAKNFRDVAVVVDPADYPRVVRAIAEDTLDEKLRAELAAKAFAHTAEYDRAVHGWLAGTLAPSEQRFPPRIEIVGDKAQDLRYGENPHQAAAFYRDPDHTAPSVGNARQLQGKELSFNNILDLDAALNIVAELEQGACAIIKHGNPCGAALGETPIEAFERALACDPVSAFGGVIALNRRVDREAAEAIADAFYEGVIAPGFEPGALERLGKKKKLRLLETGALDRPIRSGWDLRRVAGGLLVQDWDGAIESVRDGEVVTRRQPTEDEWIALGFAWVIAKHVKSNAIVYADHERTLGVGAGQMSRVDSARFAIQKAQSSLAGAVMASDAFFPFRDGLDVAAQAGIRAVVQPGGSIRDEEVVAAADEHDLAMVHTGRRHFRH